MKVVIDSINLEQEFDVRTTKTSITNVVICYHLVPDSYELGQLKGEVVLPYVEVDTWTVEEFQRYVHNNLVFETTKMHYID